MEIVVGNDLLTLETPVSFSTKQACAVAGVSYRQADYWDRIGSVRPDVQEATGSGGKSRRYSLERVCVMALAKRLMSLGAKADILRELFASLDSQPWLWRQAVVVEPDGRLVPLNEWYGSSGWLVDLNAVREQVIKRVMPESFMLVP